MKKVNAVTVHNHAHASTTLPYFISYRHIFPRRQRQIEVLHPP